MTFCKVALKKCVIKTIYSTNKLDLTLLDQCLPNLANYRKISKGHFWLNQIVSSAIIQHPGTFHSRCYSVAVISLV